MHCDAIRLTDQSGNSICLFYGQLFQPYSIPEPCKNKIPGQDPAALEGGCKDMVLEATSPTNPERDVQARARKKCRPSNIIIDQVEQMKCVNVLGWTLDWVYKLTNYIELSTTINLYT